MKTATVLNGRIQVRPEKTVCHGYRSQGSGFWVAVADSRSEDKYICDAAKAYMLISHGNGHFRQSSEFYQGH